MMVWSADWSRQSLLNGLADLRAEVLKLRGESVSRMVRRQCNMILPLITRQMYAENVVNSRLRRLRANLMCCDAQRRPCWY